MRIMRVMRVKNLKIYAFCITGIYWCSYNILEKSYWKLLLSGQSYWEIFIGGNTVFTQYSQGKTFWIQTHNIYLLIS